MQSIREIIADLYTQDTPTTTKGKSMAKGQFNKVILLGFVGDDPEIRSKADGTIFASIRLATGGRENGQDKTEWHNVVASGRMAETVRDYVKKSTHLLVEGKLQTRSWGDKESGQKKYKTEVFAVWLQMLGGPDNAEGKGSSAAGLSRSTTTTHGQRTPASQSDYGGLGITDDDIPRF